MKPNSEKNYIEAVKYFREAAEKGHSRAQFNSGVCYANGNGVLKSYTNAAKWYRKAAEQGNSKAKRQCKDCLGKFTGDFEFFCINLTRGLVKNAYVWKFV